MALGAAKRRITRETVTEVEGDEAEETEEAEGAEDQHPEAPLFSPLLRRAKRIETVTVRRTDPEDLSKWIYLGAIPVDTTESGLKAKWGGGTYRLEAKNAAGQIVPDGVRPVRVSGDPIFESEVEERKWRKANGLAEKPGGPAAPALSVTDLLRLIDEKDEKRRAEQLDREDRARKEVEAREERDRLARADLEIRKQKEIEEREERKAKEQEAREDRRRTEAREDEERRARVHREDMERLAAQNTTALQQTQQFFTQLATVMKAEASAAAPAPASDPIAMLMSGVDLAQKLGGGGGGPSDESPVAALVRRLPETLAEARRTGAVAMAEIRRGRGGGGAPAHPNRPDALTITGKLATKAKGVLQKLQAAGKDPEAEMDKLLTFAAAAIPDAPAGAAPARRPAPTQVRKRQPTRVVKRRRA